jgi:hypothetical protein
MKIFYGWKMVFAAASLQFLQSMMLHQAFWCIHRRSDSRKRLE